MAPSDVVQLIPCSVKGCDRFASTLYFAVYFKPVDNKYLFADLETPFRPYCEGHMPPPVISWKKGKHSSDNNSTENNGSTLTL